MSEVDTVGHCQTLLAIFSEKGKVSQICRHCGFLWVSTVHPQCQGNVNVFWTNLLISSMLQFLGFLRAFTVCVDTGFWLQRRFLFCFHQLNHFTLSESETRTFFWIFSFWYLGLFFLAPTSSLKIESCGLELLRFLNLPSLTSGLFSLRLCILDDWHSVWLTLAC